MNHRKSYFTLTDLLAVTVTVLLLLSALVLTGAAAAKRNLQAECAAALMKNGKGAAAYAADHNGTLPRGTLEPNQRWLSEHSLSYHKGNMLLQLSDYVPADNFLCPAAPLNEEKIYRPIIQDEACSFEANGVLSNYLGKDGAKLASITTPDRIIYMIDRGKTQIGLSITARFAGDGKHRFGRNRWKKTELIHDQRMNVLRADGSVAPMRETEIFRDSSFGLAPDGKPVF